MADLKAEQERTLREPRRRYGLFARLLFLAMDLFYGKARSLSKFTVLEVIARVPYQAWALFRQSALDERHHKLESLARIGTPRFS